MLLVIGALAFRGAVVGENNKRGYDLQDFTIISFSPLNFDDPFDERPLLSVHLLVSQSVERRPQPSNTLAWMEYVKHGRSTRSINEKAWASSQGMVQTMEASPDTRRPTGAQRRSTTWLVCNGYLYGYALVHVTTRFYHGRVCSVVSGDNCC